MFSFMAKRAMGSALSKAKQSVQGDDATDRSGGVNWSEYNYPVCLTIVHFDPSNDAIPKLAKRTVLRMKYLWYYAMGILIFNVCSNIGFAAVGTDHSVVVLYASLQLIAGSVTGGCTLYQGYRGVAGDLAKNSRIYLILQTILTILMLIFASIQSGNLHGYAGIQQRRETASQPAYLILCIVESTAWMVAICGSFYCMYTVYKYPGHERASRAEAAEAVETSREEKRSAKARGGGKTHQELLHAGDETHLAQHMHKEKKSKKKKERPPPTDDQV